VQVPLSLATGPASQLNIGGYDLCSSLSAEAFGVLLQIILQAEYSLDGERSLHLLAVSTFGHEEFLLKQIGVTLLRFDNRKRFTFG